MLNTILLSAAVIGVASVIIGVLLCFLSEKFKVEADPREHEVRELLAGSNCGGCGYAGCDAANVYEEIERLLNGSILQKKALHEYGMTEEMIGEFTDSVIANQQRLLGNNYVFLDRDALIEIYTKLF